MSDAPTAAELQPTHPALQEATITGMKGRIDAAEVEKFLNGAVGAKAPAPIGATASLNICVWGELSCTPADQPWIFDRYVWGGPAYFGAATGFLYTAYDTWDQFFQNAASVWAQGVATGGGVLQITWFNGDGTPCGQFNGVSGAAGLVECGNKGTWVQK